MRGTREPGCYRSVWLHAVAECVGVTRRRWVWGIARALPRRRMHAEALNVCVRVSLGPGDKQCPCACHRYGARCFSSSPVWFPVRLWANASSGGDHYVTQMDPNGTVRDFIDYDANLIVIGGTGSVTWRCRTARALSPQNGGSPASSS